MPPTGHQVPPLREPDWQYSIGGSDQPAEAFHRFAFGGNDAARRDKVSRLIAGNCDAACTTFGYESIEELTAFVEQTFGGARAF
jgi:hypothetical protein